MASTLDVCKTSVTTIQWARYTNTKSVSNKDYNGGEHAVGMIAEEVGEVMPEIVAYEENGVDAKGMDYSKTTPLLVEAVKALNEQLAAKDTEMAELRAESNGLKQRLEALEAIVLTAGNRD